MQAGGDRSHDTLVSFQDEAFCYLTTTGRVTGRHHTIEIWFALRGATLYLLSGGGYRSDWVRNLIAEPHVEVRIVRRRFRGLARVVIDPDEDELARRGLINKYQRTYSGDLTNWRRESLPIAVDLDSASIGH